MFAIIGPTASGKSDLAIKLALKLNYEILSLDSLSIYKEIDIASAKPNRDELNLVKHYGVDEIYPNEKFDVMKFYEILKNIPHRNLIIVGGTSFYLKSLLDGISPMPKITNEIKEKAKKLANYELLEKLDPEYAKKIKAQDSYRVTKAFEIYFETNLVPTHYFRENPAKPLIDDIPIFNIEVDRNILRDRIRIRTEKMLKIGLIDEVAYLENRYRDRRVTPLKAIGIKEVLEYFNGVYDIKELKEKIITNTARLAKRQRTFNRGQFKDIISAPLEDLEEKILKGLKK